MKTTRTRDSIAAGLLQAHGLKVTPHLDPDTRIVEYLIEGPVRETLEAIYANKPVGSMDVLRSIKALRSAIFELREGSK